MLKQLRKKNNKGQNIAEYALVIALVIGAIIAMQTFAKRALQARIFDAGQYLAKETSFNVSGNTLETLQYEPDYLASNFTSTRNQDNLTYLGNGVVANSIGTNAATNVERAIGGYQRYEYNGSSVGGGGKGGGGIEPPPPPGGGEGL